MPHRHHDKPHHTIASPHVTDYHHYSLPPWSNATSLRPLDRHMYIYTRPLDRLLDQHMLIRAPWIDIC
jgi:hypothetical protein